MFGSKRKQLLVLTKNDNYEQTESVLSNLVSILLHSVHALFFGPSKLHSYNLYYIDIISGYI